MAANKQQDKVRPQRKFKIGFTVATVWANAKDDRSWRSVDLQRSFTDKNGEWRSNSSWSLNDIDHAISVLQLARAHLLQEADITES